PRSTPPTTPTASTATTRTPAARAHPPRRARTGRRRARAGTGRAAAAGPASADEGGRGLDRVNRVLGNAGIALGLAASVLGLVTAVVARVQRGPERLRLARSSSLAVLAGAVVSGMAMQRALITRDFTAEYVAQHGSSRTPPLFNVATMWAALEGSILLWVLV